MPSLPESAPKDIKFCSNCGTALVTRSVGDKRRKSCPLCGFIHFTDPKVGVGVLVINKHKILLVKRKMNPERGKWSIPAGFLDYGEDPQETAVREVLEETNLEVEISGLLDVYFNAEAVSHGGASIFILYKADYRAGVIRAGDDAEEAVFFGPAEVPELAFRSTKKAILEWQISKQREPRSRTP